LTLLTVFYVAPEYGVNAGQNIVRTLEVRVDVRQFVSDLRDHLGICDLKITFKFKITALLGFALGIRQGLLAATKQN
jgi:hypothetical protein